MPKIRLILSDSEIAKRVLQKAYEKVLKRIIPSVYI